MSPWRCFSCCLLLWSLGVLAGCQPAPSEDTQAYIRCIEARSAPALDNANPRLEPSLPVRRISRQRSPFAPPQADRKSAQPKPTACRQCTGLARFEPKELRMLGTLANAQTTYALLAAPDQQIYRVQVGDRLGPEQARITRISAQGLTLDHRRSGKRGPRRYTYLQP